MNELKISGATIQIKASHLAFGTKATTAIYFLTDLKEFLSIRYATPKIQINGAKSQILLMCDMAAEDTFANTSAYGQDEWVDWDFETAERAAEVHADLLQLLN